MSSHRHFGQPPRRIDIVEGDPRHNHNGARARVLADRTLPLSRVPRHDFDLTGAPLTAPPETIRGLTDEEFGRLLLQAAIPDLRGDSTRRAVAQFLPREARRVVSDFNRVLILGLIAFVLAFAATVVGVTLFDLAHPDQERPAAMPAAVRSAIA